MLNYTIKLLRVNQILINLSSHNENNKKPENHRLRSNYLISSVVLNHFSK